MWTSKTVLDECLASCRFSGSTLGIADLGEVEGSTSWLRQKNQELETSRLSIAKTMLEVQKFLDSVKYLSITPKQASKAHSEQTLKTSGAWASKAASAIDEKQEMLSRLIVLSQQAFFMAQVSGSLRETASSVMESKQAHWQTLRGNLQAVRI